ncbi:GNAT family N-acetyltransferase [Shouchella lehensis]|uniref:Acetyltransferase n=1 Tax=Shouchella lehensis G1 TaxID=1246626 RepID=A0A060LRW7_9BACI|nr:GNAT family N-acetyltransferase [Shouchella lehensis]AIC92765.1 acetyltransferase [Shouchella lehensis G1]
MSVIELTTNRLKLRLFQEEEAEHIAALCNNYAIYRSTLTMPYPYTVDDARLWMKNHQENIEQEKRYELAVTCRKSGMLYGAIMLNPNYQHKHGEMAYWIGEPYWGKGYGTEALRAMIDFAFTEKNLHRVYARYFKSNPASGRVMEKAGMTKEGILKNHVSKEGAFEDLVYYGMVNPTCTT